MGSCLSVGSSKKRRGKKSDDYDAFGPAAVPPFPEEKLVVKEVLTTTENPKPSAAASFTLPSYDDHNDVSDRVSNPSKLFQQQQYTAVKVAAGKEMLFDFDASSSEMCSAGETISTMTEDKGGETEEEMSKVMLPRNSSRSQAAPPPNLPQKQQQRSISSRRRDCSGSGSRSSPSPVRRMDSSRNNQQQQLLQVNGNHQHHLNGASRNKSVRRSVSPAPKSPAADHSRQHATTTIVRTKNGSRKLIRRDAPPSKLPSSLLVAQEEMAAAVQGKVVTTGGGEEKQGGKETLDNPLVSLECFIFL